MQHELALRLTFFLASSAPLLATPGVIVVTPTGPSALQDAITAATNGDTLLVQPGTYSTCEVASKALTIVSDVPGAAIVRRLVVRDTSASQTCTVLGLAVDAPVSLGLPPRAIVLEQCAGPVRLQSVRSQAQLPNRTPGIAVANCVDVALERCQLNGSDGSASTASPITDLYASAGLECVNSRIAAYDCELRGGAGSSGLLTQGSPSPYVFIATPGAAGAELDATSTLFLSGGSARGGRGGDGVPGYCTPLLHRVDAGPGAAGGHGLAPANGASVHVLGTLLVGGLGGFGGNQASCGAPPPPPPPNGAAGAPSSGLVTTLPDVPLVLTAPTHVRAGQPLQLTVTGAPGSLALLAVSHQTRWVFDPFYEGVFLFGPVARRAVLGPIPGSGSLVYTLPSGALPVGVLAEQRVLQLVARHPSGQVELGSPAFVTVLDPTF